MVEKKRQTDIRKQMESECKVLWDIYFSSERGNLKISLDNKEHGRVKPTLKTIKARSMFYIMFW